MSTRSIMTLMTLCFITIAAWMLVALSYGWLNARLVDGTVTSVAPVAVEVPAGPSAPPPLSAYAAITERNLFTTNADDPVAKTPEPVAQETDVSQLSYTQLKLKLWGTVSGSPEKARAVIEDGKNRQQNLYREGDTLQTARVKRILREQVVLTVAGKDEVLAMEKVETGVTPAPAGQPPTGQPPASSASPFPPGQPVSSAPEKVSLARDQINEAMQDVNGLMQQAKIRPHFTDGKADGLTLTRVRRDSLFTKLGLQSGDIITGVDGQEIKSVDDALKFYNNLKNSSNLSLQVRRRGQSQTIDYNIE